MEPFDSGLIALAGALRAGEVSPTEAVERSLERVDALSGLGAFLTVTADRARERAAELTAQGPPDDPAAQPLWGVPLADKDLTARAGVRTTYGSRAFADHVPTASDPAALALDRIGAVSVGKTNTPEFGMTGYTENEISDPARNPWDPATGAGGSSGGAAVAVATGQLPASIASDGGGSIRIPAATVGVVGIKPSRGLLPFSNGLDSPGGLSVAGPIARSVADAALLLDALVSSGPHPHATHASRATPPVDRAGRAEYERMPGGAYTYHALRDDIGGMRVGATLVTPWDGWTDTALDPRALAAYERAAAVLQGGGHAVEETPWEPHGYPEMFRTMWRASAATLPLPDDQLDRLSPFTAWMVRQGRALEPAAVIAAYQAAAAFERATIAAFDRYDAVLTPALALAPQAVGWASEGTSPDENFERQCQYSPHTSFVNVSGLPAITVPIIDPDDGGARPWSVQLVGRPGGEAAIIALAAQLERAQGPLPRP